MELTIQIQDLLEHEIQERTKNIQHRLDTQNAEYIKMRKKLSKYEEENKELIKSAKEFQMVKTIKELGNKDNIEKILKLFNLKESNINLENFRDEEHNLWFKLLVKFYDDKKRLFDLLDFFQTTYPKWANNVKMPYDYNEKELEYVLNNIERNIMWNNNAFNGNMEYFYESLPRFDGNVLTLNTSKRYRNDFTIPWQLLLQNKLLLEDKFFNMIIEKIKDRKKESKYFFAITKYQQLNGEQVRALYEFLPSVEKLDTIHEMFIKNTTFMLKKNHHFAEMYKQEMNDNKYGCFHYENFPILMQIEFIKKQSLAKKIPMIKRLDISIDDKRKLLAEELDREII